MKIDLTYGKHLTYKIFSIISFSASTLYLLLKPITIEAYYSKK